MKYKLVSSSDIDILELDVNRLIRDGWEPLGGVAINAYHHNSGYGIKLESKFVQAMVRDQGMTIVADSIPADRIILNAVNSDDKS